eukprot:11667122-Ditylum_brightwellii.AAC.1
MVSFISQTLIVTILTRGRGRQEGRVGVSLMDNNSYKITCDGGNHHHQNYRLWLVLWQREVSHPLPSAQVRYHSRHLNIFYNQPLIPLLPPAQTDQ